MISFSGRILSYWEGDHAPTGEEDWEVVLHEDGLRSLRARCWLREDPPVLRDILQSVDGAFHPHDAFARIVVDGRFRGSAWYTFSDTQAVCVAQTTGEGRISQTFPIRRGIRGFGTHSLQSDGWLAAGYDLSKGPGIQTFTNNLMTSINHRGATGPMFMTTTSSLDYAGLEPIETAAGKFDCHHFSFVGTSHGYPPYHMWVTADGHYHFVRATLGGARPKHFDLVKLTRNDG
jgi:hypothetical protein